MMKKQTHWHANDDATKEGAPSVRFVPYIRRNVVCSFTRKDNVRMMHNLYLLRTFSTEFMYDRRRMANRVRQSNKSAMHSSSVAG